MSGALLGVGDAAAIAVALPVAVVLVAGLSPQGEFTRLWDPCIVGVMIFVVLVLNLTLRLYDATALGPVERFRARVWGMLLLPLTAVGAAAGFRPMPREVMEMVALTALLSVAPALLAEALVRRFLIARAAWGSNAVLIGSHQSTARLAVFLLAHPELGLNPIGFFSSGQDAATVKGADESHPLARLGSMRDTETMRQDASIGVVTLSPDMFRINLASLPFRNIIVVPDLAGIPTLWLRPRELGGVVGLEFVNSAHVLPNYHVKRAIDLCLALPALILCLPLISLLALAIMIISPGPAFYVQRRIGWRGLPIAVLKLRSMHLDADARLQRLLAEDPMAARQWATYVKLSPDPRVLPVIGNFLRRTSLDELPQLCNVVRGDMSLVGPRPFPVYHLDKFSAEFRALRARTRPGLTGLWQVSERSDANLRQQEAIDTFYIRNWSFWLDLYILLRTLPAMLSSRGAR